MSAIARTLGCCGGSVIGDEASHKPDCPSTVRAALSWIEDTRVGERHRQRGLAAFEAILAGRERLQAELDEAREVIALCAANTAAAALALLDGVTGLAHAGDVILTAEQSVRLSARLVRLHGYHEERWGEAESEEDRTREWFPFSDATEALALLAAGRTGTGTA